MSDDEAVLDTATIERLVQSARTASPPIKPFVTMCCGREVYLFLGHTGTCYINCPYCGGDAFDPLTLRSVAAFANGPWQIV